jgi:hypothetical protein
VRVLWDAEVLGHDRSVRSSTGSIELFGAEKLDEHASGVVEVGDGEGHMVHILQTGKARRFWVHARSF